MEFLSQSIKPDQNSELYKNDRERPGSASLGDDKGLRKLVDCAHAARHDHICPGILYEHELADEEIAESTAGFDILVATLLVGNLICRPTETPFSPQRRPLFAASIAPGPRPL